jgi:two-component system chemotaxis response regulator CheB
MAAPTPIVIVTGSSTAGEVAVSMHALRAGALEVLPKPPGPGDPNFEEATRKLIATVKAMAQVKVVRHWRPSAGPNVPRPVPSPAGRGIVAVAASTGGPAALQRLLTGLPADFCASILVVQHIACGFLPGMAAWLNSACDLQVEVAEPDQVLAPHTVYLAPDDRHLGVSRHGTVALSAAPPIGGFRPSATHLFESAARSCGASTIAVVLTGMGQDGVEGLRTVRQVGGRVIAQDQASCVVFGMPGAAVAAGLANHVLPLDAIADRLVELVGQAGDKL